jgi:signal transduction histidine kinase/FixJ family two-component response regulator
MIPHLSERALILAPLGRDSEVAAGMLGEAGIRTTVCAGLPDLVSNLVAGAGLAVVTEEALRTADLHALAAWLDDQPEWSDFPFILLTQRGGGLERNPGANRLLKTLGNVTFVERPFHPTTLISLAEAALRGRRRQYEARSRLGSLRELNETLETRVAAALAEQKILADVVETTDAFVQVLGPDCCWIAINRASANHFERVYGVRPTVGDNLPALLAHKPQALGALKAVWSRALAGEEFTEIHEMPDPDGGTRFYEMKFNSLHDRDGNRIGAFQFVYDVTKRLQDQKRLALAETALRQAQKMEAVGQLTGGVAHDFNNLLMAISGGLTLLDRTPNPERRAKVRDGMRQAVERGAALTRQLLAFSRRRPLEAKPLDLTAKITGMREILDRSLSGDVEVEMDFPDGLWPIRADSGELELAILNMCVNARDAMPGGGIISISAENEPAGRGKVRGEAVVLDITDAGEGMSEEVRARVFEPFFTTKEVGKGSGLGLAQVYAFVSQSGGEVFIVSKEGQGTSISLVFPRSLESADIEETPEQQVAPVSNADGANGNEEIHGHVLLVEDDREVAALTSEMLDSIGYEVTHVASPAAALGALANGRRFDVVFSDVMMPGGMSGVELAREIRRRRPDMPIMLATGYIEAARDAIAEGLEVLSKPYQIEVLERSLRDLLAPRMH